MQIQEQHKFAYCFVYQDAAPVLKVLSNRFCNHHGQSTYIYRQLQDCYEWVKEVSPQSRFFLFREEGNFECSPCDESYRGSQFDTTYQDARINIYQITNFYKAPLSVSLTFFRLNKAYMTSTDESASKNKDCCDPKNALDGRPDTFI